MNRLSLLLLLFSGLAPAAPRLFYSKYFKGSVPEFTAVTVERSGQVTYQEAKDDDNPIRVQMTEAETQQLFDLAEKLDKFQHPIESGLKVANMGTKTFRFEDGTEKHEVQFNYSVDTVAQALLDCFERIAETEQDFSELERTARYDKLGVNDALLVLDISMEHKRVVAAQQFLPLLDRIAKNDSYLHIARERASALAEAIRKPPPAPQEKTQP
jgi:hypothetical protein